MNVQYRFSYLSVLTLALCLAVAPAHAGGGSTLGYQQTNLVSDQAGKASVTDPNLVNPWGIAFSPGGPLWIANNGTGTSTLYSSSGQSYPSAATPLVVTIPPPAGSGGAAPTGMVFNDTQGFTLAPGKPSLFLFASEDGLISGWSSTVDMTHAITKVDHSVAAVYKGLALLGDQLYAANFRANQVDVFNSDFSPAGSFTDPTVPAGYAPFGIQNVGGTLLVTYALQDDSQHDDVKGPGNGYVDIFDPATHTFRRLISGGTPSSPLNSPWGLALAPAGFGVFSGQLLVGNFGDGRINAFNAQTGAFLGPLTTPTGQVITIDGLWGLAFATTSDDPTHPSLFFTAGSGDEQHGLVGRLQAADASAPQGGTGNGNGSGSGNGYGY